jgi:AcrR family transcriptional regulator
VPRPKQRTPELRDRLLEVAMDVLEAEGVRGLTTRRVAGDAGTSTAAVYELFGDKAGLVRQVFFEGFRRLKVRFDALPTTDDPLADLRAVLVECRRFAHDEPRLSSLMFSRPFAVYDPGPEEVEAGEATRLFVVGRASRCVEAGVLAGDPVDIAHVVLAVVQGLSAQEGAGWLGSSARSIDRRWDLALDATLAGFRP